ncbi:Rrf2 family transcriptional regulator [Romeria aff. gracilis LEGE 07310]|uniref:Rrf2 family transcriptional regulator n=1 Tax=Vasconcelosia minhoensis LEGE 07310 TaxID=915328 RepID=A0A8J7AIF7_9CYAN|nr:Rrf2 family transcriptional regulator [Romeria aff. gracilis LEGE 07310]
MELSCKSEYALLALIELSLYYSCGEPLQIRQIATQQNIPDRYLEQLLATLRRAGLVKSQRGAKGGYLLTREPWKITLLEIMGCIEGFESTERKPSEGAESAVVCEIWQEARQAAEAVLARYTLQDLVEKRNAKRQMNLMYYI